MRVHRPLRSIISIVLLPGLLFASLVPPARAVMINTPTAQSDHALPAPSELRSQLRDRLQTLGIDEGRVDDRLAALTDDEIRRMADRIDQLPAGGGALELLVLVFLVLLFTDILGLTDVYTFVKKPTRH